MTKVPRVTYSNVEIDLAAVHAEFDARLPTFELQRLGKRWGAIVGDDRNVLEGDERPCASPIDRELLVGSYRWSTPTVIEKAVTAASNSAQGWAATPALERVGLLRSFARMLADRRFELAMASLFEVGKSRIEAIGEAEEAVDLAEYYASEMEKHGGYRQRLQTVRALEQTETLLLPFGVFAVIAPFNFPVALAVNMISAALITGNTVVFKPAEGCGLTGRMVVEAALDAGIPAGVINMVLGDGDVGHALASHSMVSGIAFTGSHSVGMSIARAALQGAFAKPVVAEMGGKNPAYVTAHADLDVAAQGTARSAFGLQGEKCSACSVVYVEQQVRDAFLEKLCAFASGLRLGDPRERNTFMGAVQTQATVDRFTAAVEQVASVGHVLLGGRRITQGALAKGFFLEPTIVELKQSGPLSREELFMPFLAVRAVPNLAVAIAEGNTVRYGLAAGIYTRDPDELNYFLDRAQAGVLYANRASGATTGAWPGVQTFCGWKGSGVTHKGGLGPHFLPLFTKEQSRTIILN